MNRPTTPPVHRRALMFGAAAVLVGGSVPGDDEAPPSEPDGTCDVRPFAEVQATDFVFDADPTNPERGIFRVTTTEPMICAIVWGETAAFGNFNNSLSMNGTGIIDHDVFLPGAVAGLTYSFVVQGTTADSSLYRSAIGTFTIPEIATPATSEGSADRGLNLALDGTVVDVSSEFNESFAAANAIDDSGTTEWSSSGDGDDAFITIELPESSEVGGFEFVTRSMLDGTAIAETYTVTVDDGETFGPFLTATAAAPAISPVDTTGRTFRFDVETSTGGNVGAIEVRILAAGSLD